MDLTEGVGESSSPPRSCFGSFSNYDVKNDVFNRLIESGHQDAVSNPDLFRELLDSHFNRLPPSYGFDVNMDRVEDVLLHQKLLALAKDPEKRPVYHIRFLENLGARSDDGDDQQVLNVISPGRPDFDADNGAVPSNKRIRDSAIDFEPCSKLEDLNLDVRKTSKGVEETYHMENVSRRQEFVPVPIHEVIFSTVDKPKLLSQLSALLSDIGLNIREAHVFSTTDGYSLDVFVVDGWPIQDTDGLLEAMGKAIARSEGSWSGSSHSHSAVNKALAAAARSGDWEIDRRLIKIGERIASGSCGDLYHGVYFGQDVAVKVLRSEQLNDTQEEEFAQEVAILRQVEHRNIVRFIGACTKSPHLCIVTEYMPGGSLYDYLHKNHNVLKLPQLLKFGIDVCRGMEYLHQNNIIHRDLKTANLLMDTHNEQKWYVDPRDVSVRIGERYAPIPNLCKLLKDTTPFGSPYANLLVVKVADFGVARFQNQEGVMTAETGTYRWMAPEVINHQPYDQKADIFSFAIVLWELVTAKVPYDTMTPLQAALGVRQGLRPDLPQYAHPKVLHLMQRCWETTPTDRPSFSEITVELEMLLQEVQETKDASNGS